MPLQSLKTFLKKEKIYIKQVSKKNLETKRRCKQWQAIIKFHKHMSHFQKSPN